MKREKVILVLRCASCGAELHRSPRPLSKVEKEFATRGLLFAVRQCPKGCRSVLSEVNLHIRLEEIPALR